jgi:hypothetical protein
MKKHFQIIHNDRYQSKLIVYLKGDKRMNICGYVFGKYPGRKREIQIIFYWNIIYVSSFISYLCYFDFLRS